MQNAIYKICEKLRGYSDTEPYFEVIEIKAEENGTFNLQVKAVEPLKKEATNESNK